MSTEEEILSEIRAIYARLKQAEARARHAYNRNTAKLAIGLT